MATTDASHKTLTVEESTYADIVDLSAQHLLDYPIVKDSVDTVTTSPYTKNTYVQKSIALGDSAYKTFAVPVLGYISKPYQYVQPYVKKADSIGDETLSKVDARFPAFKKPTSELYAEARSTVLMPYQKTVEGRNHILSTYNAERKKLGTDGLVAYTKALVGTAFVLGSEGLAWANSTFKKAGEEASKPTEAAEK
ncbi:Perilipin MPL1-like protein [Ceratocystis lukuohia]|uniref:Perilipin MPL1-like protein n=1 Tax=Ceratocystis lukuohia TaxID=2019550 RepID=A0ABR4ML62_9PEZI